MKKTLILLLAAIFFTDCKKEETKIDEDYVISKYQERLDKIDKLEYEMKVERSSSNHETMSFVGKALISKSKEDSLLGYHFYAVRNDIPREYIYDGNETFQLEDEDKTYRLRGAHDGIMGLPGGQMIYKGMFKTQSEYEEVKLSENDSSYSLRYELEDDTIYELSNRYKIFQLTKESFLPIKIEIGQTGLNGDSSLTYNYSDIKTNDDVTLSISDIKTKLGEYTFIEEKAAEPHQLLLKELPAIELPSLMNLDEMISLNSDKVTLIDFWEYWCSPCIASFPKIEKIKNKYSSELNVIGITSDDPEKSRKLAEAKGVTFQNVLGSKKVNKTLDVRGWPTYLLIDKNGIVRKAFYGFSEDMDIETDIEKLISE